MKGKQNKKDIQFFSLHLMDNILALHYDLVNRTYQHGGYASFYINDPKRRHIHKADVRDRLLHHAVYRILYPFFDKTFISDSFSCRNGKGTHRAVNQFRKMTCRASKNNTATGWVLKCDIKKFFASIDHKVLINILNEYIQDKDIMLLLENIVESYMTVCHSRPVSPFCHSREGRNPVHGINSGGNPDDWRLDPRFHGDDSIDVGLPLGNLTSQLFANVYMNVFDQWVKHFLKARYYIRYADDFVFLSPDRQWLEDIIPKIQKFLSERLKLTLHPNKLFLKTIYSGMDFLGWINFPGHRILRRTTKRRMLAKIKNNPTPEALQSYLGLLKHGNTHKIKQELLGQYWLWQ